MKLCDETRGEEFVKNTIGRCLECGIACPATVYYLGNDVRMRRKCPTHGASENRINDRETYWLSVGQSNPAESACEPGCCCKTASGNVGTLGKNASAPNIVEQLASCTVLIDIVDSCNLKCPTCYAGSPHGIDEHLKYTPYNDVIERVQGVIDRKGGIEMLQLSGGEPTLHPEFCRIVAWALAHPKIDVLLVNTNGVRLATDDAFLADVKEVFKPGKMYLYLQFDGTQKEGQVELRAADLRNLRRDCIRRCAEFGLCMHFAMTVVEENLGNVWGTIEFGLSHKNVLGISFQPMFRSGRFEGLETSNPITAGDIVNTLIETSGGMLIRDDFTPLPCGDPNCHVVSGLIHTPDGVKPVVRHMDRANIHKVLRDKIHFDLKQLGSCGCEGQPMVEYLMEHLMPPYGFFILIKPFMSAATWDIHRIERCCTHVIRPDGSLDSFCNYYFNGGAERYRAAEPARAGLTLPILGS